MRPSLFLNSYQLNNASKIRRNHSFSRSNSQAGQLNFRQRFPSITTIPGRRVGEDVRRISSTGAVQIETKKVVAEVNFSSFWCHEADGGPRGMVRALLHLDCDVSSG